MTRNWQLAKRVENNYQRLVKVPVAIKTRAIRFIPEKPGAQKKRTFSPGTCGEQIIRVGRWA